MKHRFLLGIDTHEALAGSGQTSRPDRFARDPGGKLPGLDWLGNHTTGPDDRLVSDVGHDDTPGTDPTVSSNGNTFGKPRLAPDRQIGSIECVSQGPGWDLNERSE
jgi:hypothetical protein